uniref:CUT domain-containing protein n=1 Tax=Elaeophora elaphi TaxID=1147741 RepID=A0A0R3S7I0_9BILA
MDVVKTNGSSPLQTDTISHAGSPDSGSDMDELNTKDLAQRISAELKRYSIPQAIFAQRVLCRSQGTLSDLLRNPKPWSKLKSGRETFRRMAKWLQEPEFQRMSALRLAVSIIRGGRNEMKKGSNDRRRNEKKKM